MNDQNFKNELSEKRKQHTLVQKIKQGFLFFAFSSLLIARSLDSTSPILRFSS